MSVGTKVSLVVGVIFAAVLAFYYGLGSPTQTDLEVASNNQSIKSQEPVTVSDNARTKQPVVNRGAKRPTSNESTKQRRGLLSESVQRAINSGKTPEESNITPLAQLRMGGTDGFTPKTNTVNYQRNLAKDTGQDLKPVTPEPQAKDPLASKIVEKPRSSASGKPKTIPYKVKQNDSMWTIAKDWFGDSSKWELIAKANPYVDPDRLRLGQILQLPPKGAGPRPKPTQVVRDAPNSYRIQDGDSLSSIAEKYYGDETKWRIIYEANRDVIGNDPGALRLGDKLTIPPKSS